MPTRHAEPIAAPIELMLRNLPDQHREILVATHFRGRTTREAARQLGLTPAVAKHRLYQAMRDLSEMVAASQPRRHRRSRHDHRVDGRPVPGEVSHLR